MKELSLCVTMKLDLLLYFLHWVIVWLRRFKLYLIDILLRCSLPWPAGGSSGDMLPGDCGWLPLEERFKSETVYKRIYHHQVDLIFSYTRTNVRVNHLIFPIHRLPTLDFQDPGVDAGGPSLRRHPLLLRWLFLHFISILKALPYVSGAKKLKTCDSGQVWHVHTWIQWNWGRRQTPKIHMIHMAVAVMPMCENELK